MGKGLGFPLQLGQGAQSCHAGRMYRAARPRPLGLLEPRAFSTLATQIYSLQGPEVTRWSRVGSVRGGSGRAVTHRPQ